LREKAGIEKKRYTNGRELFHLHDTGKLGNRDGCLQFYAREGFGLGEVRLVMGCN